jgi:hypothetical protein
MKCHYKLALPNNPLRPHKNFKFKEFTGWSVFPSKGVVKSIINEDVLDALADLKMYPALVVVFSQTELRNNQNCFLHSDVTLLDKTWTSIPFAINWELNEDIDTTVSWWDTSKYETLYPPMTEAETKFPFNLLNGTRYNIDKSKSCVNHLHNIELLDAVHLYKNDSPILFRTDVPHSLEFTTNERCRFNLSLRFDLAKVVNWQEAVEKLQPIFKI